jgi:hypothetical protein
MRQIYTNNKRIRLTKICNGLPIVLVHQPKFFEITLVEVVICADLTLNGPYSKFYR